jgi:glucose 1-dehydrogenase/3-oxoacyl-[acyl-carrier protein] reductase
MKSATGGDVAGKIVVVTGASKGIGAGIAQRLCHAGACVVLNFRSNAAKAQEFARKIKAEGGKVICVQADVTRGPEVERLMSETIRAYGGIDAVINNAGTYPMKALLEMEEEDWDEVIGSNLRSVYLCTRAAAKRMIEGRRKGAIVNIASIEGENPAAMHSHYCAAKAGVIQFTRAAALELGPHNIRVNAISPGVIWHENIEREWPDGVGRYVKTAPLRSLGQPRDIADSCLFLISADAKWITGINLRVDGGLSASPGY